MLRKNRIHTAVYAVLGVVIAVMAILLYVTARKKHKLDMAVTNSYNKAFFELTDYVGDIDVLLTKAQLAATPSQLAAVSNEIFMQAAEAKSCFGELPSMDINLEKTAKFLSQVGDYTYVLSQNMINGKKPSKEEYDTLSKLNDYASELSKGLSAAEQRIYSGEIELNTAFDGRDGTTVFASADIFADLEKVEKAFEGYPSLIYDGPFSEHIENAQSELLKAATEFSRDEAYIKAAEFLGGSAKDLKYQTETKNTAIECYVFSKKEADGDIYINITKKGGYVLYFLKNKPADRVNYGVEEATAAAMKYLEKHGYDNMEKSYYEITDNIATINFAYVQNGVKMYSDLVKVRVALDSCEITGIECKGYLMNHKIRETINPQIGENEARGCVSTQLSVNSAALAVIPKDSLREILCYEFHGSYKGKNFIVYINAQNGCEEEILLLIESETGILTV